jgi:hypothetical protein
MREDAPRQVLEHLAFGTVVIDRMRRTAGDRRSIELIIVMERFTGMVMPCRRVAMAVEIADDPGQRTERWPRKGHERARRNPVAPAVGAMTDALRG